MTNGLIFPEVGSSFLQGGASINFIDWPDVLGAHFVDDVGAVGFVALLFGFEKAELSSLAELR